MPVHIGSKYTGRPAHHIDSTTGTYWEALPKIEGSMLGVQRALLAPVRPARQPRRLRLPTLVGMAK